VIGRVHVARDTVRELRDVLDVDRIERHGRTAGRGDLKAFGRDSDSLKDIKPFEHVRGLQTRAIRKNTRAPTFFAGSPLS
jgi:hypothetical protein